METQKLAALLQVIECGSITKASEELGYTQSGLSHLIRSIERELGFSVLLRSKTGVEPTEDCRKLLPALRKTVHWSKEIDVISTSIRGVLNGKIRIGAFTSLSVNYLPRVIRTFRAQYPNVELELVDSGGKSLTNALESGVIDIGFGCRPKDAEVTWIPLFDDQLMLVAAMDAEIGTSFPLNAFQGAPFIALPDSYDREVHDLFAAGGIVPDVKFTSTDDYTIISMVEQGLGVSVLPEMVLRGYRHCKVRIVPLEPVCKRKLGIILPAKKEVSPAARQFIACAKNIPFSSKDA